MESLDNRTRKHKKPCKDCPFRKDSIPGYLGGYEIESYAEPVEYGIPTSCHLTDRGIHHPKTAFCAGSLSTLAAEGKAEPGSLYEKPIAEVGPREDTFSSPEEFRKYHEGMNRRMVW